MGDTMIVQISPIDGELHNADTAIISEDSLTFTVPMIGTSTALLAVCAAF
jgi:hypothetical protein